MTQNALEPIVDAIFNYCKWFKSCWIEPKFNFKDFFKVVGLKNKEEQYPKLIKSYTGDLGTVYLFNVPIGLNMSHFEKIKDSLEIQLKNPISIRVKSGFIEIETIEKKLSSNIPYQLPKRYPGEGIRIPIGDSLNGEVVLDLKSDPHTVVSGVTGGGKSVCVKSMITSIMSTYKPSEVSFYFIDFKIVELSLFEKCTDYVKAYVTEIDEAKELLADLMSECKRRYKLFKSKGVTNIHDYNRLVSNKDKLKQQIIVIEEFVEFTQDKKKTAMGLLKRFSSLARASGQYLILTGQRFDNTVIDLVLRNNLSNRVIFQMSDEANSKLLLDVSGAETINIKGRCYVKVKADITECQSYFISDSEVKKLIKPYIKNEPIMEPQRSFKSDNDKLIDNKKKEEIKVDEIDLSFLD